MKPTHQPSHPQPISEQEKKVLDLLAKMFVQNILKRNGHRSTKATTGSTTSII